MKKDQKSTVVNETNSGLKNAVLDEIELDNVSGGFELPTIIDLCQNKFDYDTCVHAPWGSCKHFSRIFVKEEHILQTCYFYAGSCDKGCFKGITYPEFL